MRSFFWGIVLLAIGAFCFFVAAPYYGEANGTGYIYIGLVLMLLGIVVAFWKPVRRWMIYRSAR